MNKNFNKLLFVLTFSTALGSINNASATDISTIAQNSIEITGTSATEPTSGTYFSVPNGTDVSGNPILTYYSYVPSTAGGHYSDIVRQENPTGINNVRFISVSTGNFLGGAIFNNAVISSDIIADFVSNNAYSNDSGWDAKGGAIFNSGTTQNISGDFVYNHADSEADPKWSYGGAIYNNYSGVIGNFNSNFVANYVYSKFGAALGGAVYNGSDKNSPSDPFASIGNFTGDFVGNYATAKNDAKGGAIFNGSTVGNITGNFVNNYVYSDTLWSYGGAIFNDNTIGDISGNFTDNYAYSKTAVALGGAIYNAEINPAIGKITGMFKSNFARSDSSDSSHGALGGAIHNSSSITDITADFVGNYVYSLTNSNGGAIYNNGTISNLSGDFKDNYAQSVSSDAKGGAIYNEKTIKMSADRSSVHSDIIFKGNYIQAGTGNKQYEAIYNKGSSAALTFSSDNGGTYTFYDYINGDDTATINFVSDDNEGAKLNIYNDIKGQNLIDFQNKYVLNMLSADDIHTGTSKFSIISGKNITVSAAIQMAVDVDLANSVMDHFEADNFTILGIGSVNVQQMNLISDSDGAIGEKVTIPFVVLSSTGTATGLDKVTTDVERLDTELFSYAVTFNAETGDFEFTKDGISSKHRESAEETATSVAMIQEDVETIVSQVLNHYMVMATGANSGDETLGLTAWVQAFGSNDDIELKHLSNKIETQFYGLIGGIDSRNFVYDNGANAVYGVYASYVEGKQKLDNAKITQESGYLGLSAALRKENFFTNLTLLGGYLANETNTVWGKDKFDTKVIALATKTGVDVHKDAWTITPSLLLSYTGLDTDDYTAKSGTKVDNKFMNVFTIAPELEVARDLGEGLNGYAKVSYKLFFYDNNKITADDVLMPAMSVKPYVEYGVGLTKDWSQEEWNPKDLATFAEINRHDGGREGWDLNLGLKLDF